MGRPSQGGGFAGLGMHPSNFAFPWGTTQHVGLQASGIPDWLTGRLPAVWFAFAASRGHSPSTDALASACSGNKDGLSGPHALGEHI